MTTTYTIQLVPIDGPTLERRTDEMWNLQYEFEVVASDWLALSRGAKVNITELNTQREYNDVEFVLDFQYQSVVEHINERAEHDYGFEASRDAMLALLTRGQ